MNRLDAVSLIMFAITGFLFIGLSVATFGGWVDGVYVFKETCQKHGYYNVDKTTRIKCTVEKLEWEKAE